MRKGTTSRVMAADRPYGEFYDFYSVSPVYFGYTLVYKLYKYKEHRVQQIPVQVWRDPKGSRTLRLPDFKTFVT
jgi:hypothetical protein